VTIALPDKLVAAQDDAVKVDNVYVVVLTGLTVTLIGLVDPEKEVPFDKVPLHGPLPVTPILKFVELPLQILVVPLTTPVGNGLTVIVTNAVFEQPLPVTVPVTVYVVVLVGTKATPFEIPPDHE
jgi:hypothetical protein